MSEKTNIIKKMINSLYNFNELPKYMFEGLPRAIVYLLVLSTFLGFIRIVPTCIDTNNTVNEYIDMLHEEKNKFTIKNNKLDVKTSPIVREENNLLIYIDDKTSMDNVNKLKIDSVDSDYNILLLEDGVKINAYSMDTELINQKYSYSDLGISSDFNNDDLISNLSSMKLPIIIILIIVSILSLFVSNIFLVVLFGLLGYTTSMVLKLRLRYKQLVSLVAYSITLPLIVTIILNLFMPTINFSLIIDVVTLLIMSLVLWNIRKFDTTI